MNDVSVDFNVTAFIIAIIVCVTCFSIAKMAFEPDCDIKRQPMEQVAGGKT